VTAITATARSTSVPGARRRRSPTTGRSRSRPSSPARTTRPSCRGRDGDPRDRRACRRQRRGAAGPRHREGGFEADRAQAVERIDGTLLAITAVLILVILLAVYRSPLTAAVPLGVVAGVMLLLGLAGFNATREMVPMAVIVLAGLTLLPAVLAVLGRRVFWPAPAEGRAAAPRGLARAAVGSSAARPPSPLPSPRSAPSGRSRSRAGSRRSSRSR
jgi:hypothetical protein